MQLSENGMEPVYTITTQVPPMCLAWPPRPAIDELRPLVAAFQDGSLIGLDMEPCAEVSAGLAFWAEQPSQIPEG